MKRRATGALVAFLVVMLCFGMLSRAVESAGIALVATAEPRAMSIEGEAWETCVPATAVHQDEHRQSYVLVVEERAGFLGDELVARRVDVGVLTADANFAALGSGAIGSRQQVIVRADRDVGDGDRVRCAGADAGSDGDAHAAA